MTEAQADRILKEMKTIKVRVIVLTVIIALALAKTTFNLRSISSAIPPARPAAAGDVHREHDQLGDGLDAAS